MEQRDGICIWRPLIDTPEIILSTWSDFSCSSYFSTFSFKTSQSCFKESLSALTVSKSSSFSDVFPYRVSLRKLSRVWPYCSPWSSYGLPTQTPNCFVDVKYCTSPRELWSQWSQELLLRLTVTLCSWIVKRQNQKHKWTQTECPDL